MGEPKRGGWPRAEGHRECPWGPVWPPEEAQASALVGRGRGLQDTNPGPLPRGRVILDSKSIEYTVQMQFPCLAVVMVSFYCFAKVHRRRDDISYAWMKNCLGTIDRVWRGRRVLMEMLVRRNFRVCENWGQDKRFVQGYL